VNVRGAASVTVPLLGEEVPLAHDRLAVTDAPLFGTKSLFTTNVRCGRL
jgi:hypothetical protein